MNFLMNDRSAKYREFFAKYVAGNANPGIANAFALVPRERFAGPGPWSIRCGDGYIRTPDDDPAFIYQDVLIGLDPDRGINIGMPSAHAAWLDKMDLREGDRVIQVGAGTGYYTAVIAEIVGASGTVTAFEIDEDLAARARQNLKDYSQVLVTLGPESAANCLRPTPSTSARRQQLRAGRGSMPCFPAVG